MLRALIADGKKTSKEKRSDSPTYDASVISSAPLPEACDVAHFLRRRLLARGPCAEQRRGTNGDLSPRTQGDGSPGVSCRARLRRRFERGPASFRMARYMCDR